MLIASGLKDCITSFKIHRKQIYSRALNVYNIDHFRQKRRMSRKRKKERTTRLKRRMRLKRQLIRPQRTPNRQKYRQPSLNPSNIKNQIFETENFIGLSNNIFAELNAFLCYRRNNRYLSVNNPTVLIKFKATFCYFYVLGIWINIFFLPCCLNKQ